MGLTGYNATCLSDLATARIVGRLRQFKARTGLAGTEICRVTDVPGPRLSNLLNGKRRHVSAHSAGKLVTFMNTYVAEPITIERTALGHAIHETDSTGRADVPAEFIETSTARTVARALDMCARRRINGAIFGDPGCGKSEALRAWSAKTKHRHAIVYCRPYTTYTKLVAAIARVLGVTGRTSTDLDEDIHRVLAQQPRLLVLDEADMLGVRTLDWVRTLWDESGRKSAFFLLAKPAFYERLKVAHVRSRHQDLSQVWSRLAFRKFVTGITRKEMDEFLAERGLASKLETTAGDALYEGCGGSFRDLVMLLEILYQIGEDHAGKLKGRITAEAVDLARETRFGADILRGRR